MKVLNSFYENNGVIAFLLNTVPLDELDDCLVDIASKYRAGIISEVNAVEYIVENKIEYIKAYIQNSLEIIKMLGSWTKLAE